MKVKDVPDKALIAHPTPIPTKLVPDWDMLYLILKERGFVVIESEDTRISANGTLECVPVKKFNCYVRTTRKGHLYTRRISGNRWVCTL